jgi:hypothetical protein
LAVAALALLVPAPRAALLRAAGRMLVAEDPLQRADVIVIAADAGAAGVLEAADLVRAGIASRVALFSPAATLAARELMRRGVRIQDSLAVMTEELRALGVASIVQIPQPVTGTEDEGRRLHGWCRLAGIHSIVFVSTADHSRRTRRVLRRALRGTGVSLIERAARYSPFAPEGWWNTRAGTRTELVESEKLLLELMRHPFG